MTFWITLFIASGTALILIVLLKTLQMRLGFLLFWPDLRQSTEKSLARKVNMIEHFFNAFSTKNFYIILHYFLTVIRKEFAKIQGWLDQKSARLVRLITGKQHLGMQGKASHFLYDIRSFKDKFRRH